MVSFFFSVLPPNFSFLVQMNAFGETFEEWLLHNYSAFWHLDRHSPAIVTHWFRFRISVGSVGIHHSEEDSDPSFLGGEDLGSIIFWWEKSSIHHFWGGGGGECGDFEEDWSVCPQCRFFPRVATILTRWSCLLAEEKRKNILTCSLLSSPVVCHLGSKISCSLSIWFACIGVWLWYCKALLRWNNFSILVLECG